VISWGVALVSFTAENQRLKVSALTCGFKAATSFVHNWAFFSSMATC
jgi:hypothetical protein